VVQAAVESKGVRRRRGKRMWATHGMDAVMKQQQQEEEEEVLVAVMLGMICHCRVEKDTREKHPHHSQQQRQQLEKQWRVWGSWIYQSKQPWAYQADSSSIQSKWSQVPVGQWLWLYWRVCWQYNGRTKSSYDGTAFLPVSFPWAGLSLPADHRSQMARTNHKSAFYLYVIKMLEACLFVEDRRPWL
jgi:hypothetical protein